MGPAGKVLVPTAAEHSNVITGMQEHALPCLRGRIQLHLMIVHGNGGAASGELLPFE